MKKITKLLILSLTSLLLASCGSKSESNNNSGTNTDVEWNDKSSIEVDELAATIEVGATYQINAKGSGTLVYTSTDETVATVNDKGLVTALVQGDVAIKIANEEDHVYVRFHVGEASGAQIDGTLSVYLPSKSLTLYPGEAYTLTPKAMVNGSELKNTTFSYQSNNPRVAIVDEGKINALSGGIAIIKVTANSEGNIATAQVTVNVTNNMVYLVPDFETREVVTGSPITLNVALILNSTTLASGYSAPIYSLNNNDIAYISGNQLFAVRKGNVELTATVTYGGEDYSFTTEIAVKELYKVTYTYNSETIYEEYVKSGDHISYKETPTRIDSVFKAWNNGEKLIYSDTPIDYPMTLEPKWLVYSTDIFSDEKILLWDYSTGNEIVCNNNAGCYLWEDFQYPDCRVNVQMTNKTLELTEINLPKFEYALFPAISFYFYNNFDGAQFVYGNYASNPISKTARNQVSIVGNKLYFNGTDTGEVISSNILSATEKFTYKIKVATNIGGKMCVSGFYCHLSEE